MLPPEKEIKGGIRDIVTYTELMERHNIRLYIGILPGLAWLETHEHDLDDWQPHVELSSPGFRHSLTIKPEAAKSIREIMRINKRGIGK